MPKIRKNVKRKKYQYNRNRKRMNKDRTPRPACKALEKNWNRFKSTATNMKRMGLTYDVNARVKKSIKSPPLAAVAENLENEANAEREKGYRLPRNQVEFLIEMLNKYGEDYKKMVADKKNYGQLTWKQFRKKVNEFKNIPEQYQIFLDQRKEPTEVSSTPMDDDDGEW